MANLERPCALWIAMLERANAPAALAEFCNTLIGVGNIIGHVDLIAPELIPFSCKSLLPTHSDDLAFDHGRTDSDPAREYYHAAFRINDLAQEHADSVEFREAIRSLHRD